MIDENNTILSETMETQIESFGAVVLRTDQDMIVSIDMNFLNADFNDLMLHRSNHLKT